MPCAARQNSLRYYLKRASSTTGGQGFVLSSKACAACCRRAVMLQRDVHGTARAAPTVTRTTALGPTSLSPKTRRLWLRRPILMRGESSTVCRSARISRGWVGSTLSVGDETLIKVHSSRTTADPIGYAINAGAALDDVVVETCSFSTRRSRQTREEGSGRRAGDCRRGSR